MKNIKLEELEKQQAIEKHNFQIDHFTQQRVTESWKFVGKLLAVSSMRRAINSQELLGLKLFQSEERYKEIGFDNFVEFLNSEHSPCTKSQYYERIKLLESEGEQAFDLLNEFGVSNSVRKLLSSGNYDAIEIVDGVLTIGDQTADLSNAKLVRSLIESYADDCKRLTTENAKKQTKLETAEKTITDGFAEVEKLKRAASERDQFETILTKLMLDLRNFAKVCKELSEEQKAEKTEDSLRCVAEGYYEVADALGSGKQLTTKDKSDIDNIIDTVLDTDFDDD